MRFIILLMVLVGYLQANSKEALLIGNSDYRYITDLQNPKTSIQKLERALKKLDFHVTTLYNLDAENLSAEVERFRDRLSSNSIGFFYYSGHGCQLNHQSYLIPTNVDTKKASKIKYHALGVGELLDILSSANNRVNMLFLDACRDVPVGSRGGTKGLGQISVTPKGTLVVYATEAGKVAEDSTLFISELTKTILKPNKKVWEIGNHLSNTIASKTNDRQIPEMFSKRLPSGLVLLRGERREVEEVVAPTSEPISSFKWITPTTKKATWKKAKQICKENGARLPTIEELRKVIIDCGGINNQVFFGEESSKNLENSNYQSCYKKKGFTSKGYWSSTTDASDSSNAWFVGFYYGYDGWFAKGNESHVRCVRG